MAEDDDEEADKEGTGGHVEKPSPHPPAEEHTKYLRMADCKQSV